MIPRTPQDCGGFLAFQGNRCKAKMSRVAAKGAWGTLLPTLFEGTPMILSCTQLGMKY